LIGALLGRRVYNVMNAAKFEKAVISVLFVSGFGLLLGSV
jgi:hypothetical protein